MATVAVVLGVRLRKPGAYDLREDRRPPDGRTASDDLPTRADAERGVAVVSRAGWLAFGLAGVGVIALC
jgi:adenosylcobinamide-phosphate synthase